MVGRRGGDNAGWDVFAVGWSLADAGRSCKMTKQESDEVHALTER